MLVILFVHLYKLYGRFMMGVNDRQQVHYYKAIFIFHLIIF
jgi:hypothetical protein